MAVIHITKAHADSVLWEFIQRYNQQIELHETPIDDYAIEKYLEEIYGSA